MQEEPGAMKDSTKYTIFETKWGYFGLLGTKNRVFRSALPRPKWQEVERRLVENLTSPKYEKRVFKELQAQIRAYFDGSYVNFGKDIPIVMAGLSKFSRQVLEVCRDVKYGQTISYGRLAEMAGKTGAARAVGGVLSRNRLPLIIPCHRILCANGKIGGFGAAGGVELKKKMLEFEQKRRV
jgi:methylated-DNA-[protein]-cysteine S-methyltransferase